MTEFLARRARAEDVEWIEAAFPQMGSHKPEGYFGGLVRLQARDALVFLVAEAPHGEYAGHLKLIWEPDYPGFRERGIPEIQDLNVLSQFRRKHVATLLVDEAERLAGERSSQVGIGFGLYSDYGPAQRMYVKRGYVPDGKGVAYHGRTAKPGQEVTVDDSLVLFLVKDLHPPDRVSS